MNVTYITGGEGDSSLWAYFALAVSLMCATFGGRFVWERHVIRKEGRAAKPRSAELKV